jgi:hypothetical protein
MYYVRKLKPDRSVTGLLPAFISVAIFALTSVIFDLTVGLSVLGVLIGLYALYSFIAYLKTNNWAFIIASLYQLSLALLIWSQSRAIKLGDLRLTRFFLVSMVFFLVWMVYLAINKKLKWRGREILEMAAEPVDETADGYTARPLSTGKIEYSQRDIIAFADFARQNLIAITYIEKDKVALVPVKMGEEFNAVLGLRSDYTQATWVAFDHQGNVSVNISRKDYLNYKENLSFDQLCASLSELFVEFLEMFTRGEGVRIIDRMDAVGLNPFS